MALAVVLAGTLGLVTPDWAQGAVAVPAARVGGEDAPGLSVEDAAVEAGAGSSLVAASVAARVSGVPVELTGLRDEFSTTWVNPDGSLTTEVATGQVRFAGEDGDWVQVDLELVANPDGTVAPVGHPEGLVFAGGDVSATGADPDDGGTDLVALTHTPTEVEGEPGTEGVASGDSSGGEGTAEGEALAGEDTGSDGSTSAPVEVVLGLPALVGEPVLEGPSATYVDVWPGVDVVVQARRDGFEQWFVITEAAAVEALPGEDGVASWSMPVRAEGATARLTTEGAVEFVDADGVVVSTLVAPLAWDATVDKVSGLPANYAPVTLDVGEVDNEGTVEVSVSVDRDWLSDEDRVFPVTVDPTYATGSVNPSFDTRATKAIVTPAPNDPELWAGTWNGGVNIARSYLNVPTGALVGKQIVSAELSLYQSWSWSCTATPVAVHEANATVDASTVWTNRPTHNSAVFGQVSAAKKTGGTGACAPGRVGIPMTAIAQSWAGGAAATKTLVVKAVDEGDDFQWKRFSSAQGSQPPVVKFTYNRAPGTPARPVLSSGSSNSYVDPPTGVLQWWAWASMPYFESSTSDADGNTSAITYEVHTSTTPTAQTLVASCTTGTATGGTVQRCRPSINLPDQTRYHVRARATDSLGLVSGWSPWLSFWTSRVAAATPVITCPDPYSNGSWQPAKPAAPVVCTVSGAAASTYQRSAWLDVQVDEGPVNRVAIEPSSIPAVAKTTVTIPATAGGHTIRAVGVSRSLRTSPLATYGFGSGPAGMDLPAAGQRPTTTGTVKVAATAPGPLTGQSVTATVKYRVAGSGADHTTGWHTSDVPLTVTVAGGKAVAKGDWDAAAASVNTDTGAEARVPVVLELQVCFSYGGGVLTRCTGESEGRSVFRVPHAFGNGFPVTDAGPGQVALFTGEFNTVVSDASVPAYSGELSLSRSHSTYAGPASVTAGVFGPGWTAHLDGSDAGVAGAEIVDNTHRDGSIVLIDPEGTALVFDSPAGRRTTGTFAKGIYDPGSEDSALSGLSLEVKNNTAGQVGVVVTDFDGVQTTFRRVAAPVAGVATVFAPETVTEPGVPGQTSYLRDAAGRVTDIISAGAGITCTAPYNTPGCRVLLITYATTTTGGDVAGQVKSVSARLHDPASNQMVTTVLATFTYDSAKRLTQATDARTNLTTAYAYDGTTTALAGVTPPGLTGFTLSYTGGTGTTPARLDKVSRGGIQQQRFLYGLDPSTPVVGLPDLTGASAWGQEAAPTYSAAVFGPDHPVTNAQGQLTAADWQYADLSYTDPRGYTVNSASYGAGAWQISHTGYDKHGNVVTELEPSAVAQSGLFGPIEGDPWPAEAILTLATQTVYNETDLMSGTTVLTPAGSRVTDTYGPARTVHVPGLGKVSGVRPHTATLYDQAAPNGGLNAASGTGYNLATTVTITAADAGKTDIPDPAGGLITLSQVQYGYDKVVGTDGSGWDLGMATKTITGAHTPNPITTVTRYDTQGRLIESRQPSEATTGTGPGTRRTTYYTTGTHPTDTACGNKPAWAGLTCRTYPAATTPTGLPDERTTGYSMWLDPTIRIETSGSATRTSTTTYDTAGRVVTSSTTLSGVPNSAPVPTRRTVYHPSTGLVTGNQTLNSSGVVTAAETTSYDTWGRPVTYTNQLGDVTTTGYDAAGRVHTLTHPQGSTTYTYNGTDATGNPERRGLTTKTVHTFDGRTHTMTAAYDHNGSMTTQTLPAGITQTTLTDAAGEPVELFYQGRVHDPDTQSFTTGTWLGWEIVNDTLGRVAAESTPAGAVFDGSDTTDPDGTGGAGEGHGYERAYTYDAHSRLVSVDDATATGYAGTIGDPDVEAVCTRRAYTFDANSNRTNLATSGCDGTTVVNTTWAYNTADGQTTGTNGVGAYTYDDFGRQTTLPASDAPHGQALTLSYHHDDTPAGIAVAGLSTTFTLDAQGRRLQQTTAGQGPLPGGGAPIPALTRHYTDTSDNPGWVQATDGTITSYAPSLGGDLGIQMAKNGVHALTIANPHGDIVTTIPIPTSGEATGITAWSDYTEYGAPRDAAAARTVGGPTGNTWLGAKERATAGETFGLTLMGARYYNPTTGRFTSHDPIHGGNPNSYTYPTDPLNVVDLDGRAWCPKLCKLFRAWTGNHNYQGGKQGIGVQRSNGKRGSFTFHYQVAKRGGGTETWRWSRPSRNGRAQMQMGYEWKPPSHSPKSTPVGRGNPTYNPGKRNVALGMARYNVPRMRLGGGGGSRWWNK